MEKIKNEQVEVNLNENVDAAEAVEETAVAEEVVQSVQERIAAIQKDDELQLGQKAALLEQMNLFERADMSKDDKDALDKALDWLKDMQELAFLQDWTKLTDELIEMGSNLEEVHILRRVAKRVESRIKEISDDALQEGLEILKEEKRDSGAFEFNGYEFEISAKPVYDFVGHYQSYKMKEGVEFRKLYKEREQLKALSKTKTEKMAAITKSFPLEHPDWTPDWTELILKCK